MSKDPREHHCLSKAEARGNAGMFALKWWSTSKIFQSQHRAGALGHGSKQCTPAVYTCMPGGTSSGMPGLPDTVTWWERQLPLEGSLCARIYIALQGGEVGRDSNQHQIQHELTPKSLE